LLPGARSTGGEAGASVARTTSQEEANVRKLLGALVLTAAALAATGCMTVRLDTGAIREPVSMSGNVNRDYRVVRHFQRDLKSWFTLFDLVTVQNPKVEQAVREELQRNGGDGVVNLVISGKDTFIDRLIPAAVSALGSALTVYGAYYNYGYLTAGAVITVVASQIRIRTYTVEGDVVQYVK
jgi:hypothetical protein